MTMIERLTALMADPMMLLALGGALWILVLAVVLGPSMARARMVSLRVRTLGRVETGDRPSAVRERSRRPTGPVEAMRRVLTRLDLMRADSLRGISAQLATAGWRSRSAQIVYMFAKLTLPISFGAVTAAVLFWVMPHLMAPPMRLMVVLVAVLVGSYAPDLVIRRVAEARRERIRRQLPDGLDLMVICAEAGLSLDATMERVSRELAPSSPELADELQVLALELNLMGDRRQAFDNLARRVDLSPVQALAASLGQTERFGTPIAQSLRVLATEQRNYRMIKAEEKAARLPATMTVPMILFILPAVFAVLLGPALLSILDAVKDM